MPTTPTLPYETAAKALATSGLQGADQIAAQNVLKGYYDKQATQEPVVLSSEKGKQVIQDNVHPVVLSGTEAINKANTNKQTYIGADGQTYSNSGGGPVGGGEQLPSDLTDPEAHARSLVEKDFNARQSLYKSLAVANTAETEAEVNGIMQSWADASRAQREANDLEKGIYTQSGFRSGQTRYAPELQASMMADVQNKGIARLTKIDTDYRSAIAKANSALKSGNLQLAMQAASEAKQHHEDALTEILSQKKEAMDLAEKARNAKMKVSRQAAIIDLVKQGITDPSKLFDYLNFDEQGNATGDITTDEINGVLKQIMPDAASGGFNFSNDDVGKLINAGMSAQDVRALQEDLNAHGPDAVLAGIPSNQRSVVKRILGGAVAGSGSVGGTISITEARGLGLPLSLVGRPQTQVLADLQRTDPPSWFSDYVETNGNQNYTPEKLDSLWQDFRDHINSTFETGKTAGAASGGDDIAAQIEAAFPTK